MLDTESRETLHILFGNEEYCRMLITDKVRFDPGEVTKFTVFASEAKQSKVLSNRFINFISLAIFLKLMETNPNGSVKAKNYQLFRLPPIPLHFSTLCCTIGVPLRFRDCDIAP